MLTKQLEKQWLYELLAVFIGGALGSLARFALSVLIDLIPGAFPYATVIINIAGSLIIGFCYIYFTHKRKSSIGIALINIGFLGGFTTFSSFSLDNVTLLEQSHFILFAINLCATLVLCFSATAIGIWFGKKCFQARP